MLSSSQCACAQLLCMDAAGIAFCTTAVESSDNAGQKHTWGGLLSWLFMASVCNILICTPAHKSAACCSVQHFHSHTICLLVAAATIHSFIVTPDLQLLSTMMSFNVVEQPELELPVLCCAGPPLLFCPFQIVWKVEVGVCQSHGHIQACAECPQGTFLMSSGCAGYKQGANPAYTPAVSTAQCSSLPLWSPATCL